MVLPNLQRYVSYLTLAAVVLFIAGPVAAIAFSGFSAGGLQNVEFGQLVLPAGRRLALLAISIKLALSSAVACMVLSWFIGGYFWHINRRHPAFACYTAVLLWFVALLPSFIHSYTWLEFFGAVNELLGSFSVAGIPFSGLAASWWTQTMAWLPLSLSIALCGFRSVDPDFVDAAQISASPLRVLVLVVTPLAAPALLAGGVLVFLLCLQDYSIPSLFQVSTYALEIFADFSAHNQPFRAMWAAFPVFLVSIFILSGTIPFFRHAASAVPRLGREQASPFPLPFWLRVLQRGCTALLCLQVLSPLTALMKTAGSWDKAVFSIMASRTEIIFSFQTALCGAFLATAVAAAAAGAAPRLWAAAAIPLAVFSLSVPAALTGIGLIVLGSSPLFMPLYQSELAPVAAILMRFGSLAVLIIAVQVSRLDQRLLEAARFYPVGSWRIWTRIRLPLMWPGIIVAFMTVFLLAMGEMSATLLVLPPGRNTLAVKTYNLLHYGASDAVAGLCLFTVLTGWLVGIAAAAFFWYRGERA